MSKEEAIINLDECVINALDLFENKPLPKWNIPFHRPLVVGSGNAAVSGKILFHDADAVFADESDYEEVIEHTHVDGAILISASAGKHAPIIARKLAEKGIRTVLVTNNPSGEAHEIVHDCLVFPKNPEPYTYNTSTYMGMILAKTKEDSERIKKLILELKPRIPRNLKNYDSFYFIIPEGLEHVREMFLTKFDELFGSKVSARVYTLEQTKHSKTIIPNDKELFISLGVENKLYGKKRWNVQLPEHLDYGGMMAIGYFIIGNIQRQHPPYFRNNIKKYMAFTSKVFGERIEVIVR